MCKTSAGDQVEPHLLLCIGELVLFGAKKHVPATQSDSVVRARLPGSESRRHRFLSFFLAARACGGLSVACGILVL